MNLELTSSTMDKTLIQSSEFETLEPEKLDSKTVSQFEDPKECLFDFSDKMKNHL